MSTAKGSAEAADRAGAVVSDQVRAIVAAAHTQADEIVSQAQRDAHELQAEAIERAQAVVERVASIEDRLGGLVADLQQESGQMSGDVDARSQEFPDMLRDISQQGDRLRATLTELSAPPDLPKRPAKKLPPQEPAAATAPAPETTEAPAAPTTEDLREQARRRVKAHTDIQLADSFQIASTAREAEGGSEYWDALLGAILDEAGTREGFGTDVQLDPELPRKERREGERAVQRLSDALAAR